MNAASLYGVAVVAVEACEMGTCVPLLTLPPLKGLPEATLEILHEGIAGLELELGQKASVGNSFEMV